MLLKAAKRIAFRFCANPREKMEYDVAIVGGGIAGLSTAIKLKQQEKKYDRPISVCILEKGGEIGNHILSGNVFEPRALDQLFPDWRTMPQNRPPLNTPVTEDDFYILLDQNKSFNVPKILHPPQINNHGNFVLSLGKMCIWLAQKATDMGVDIFTGYPAADIIYDNKGAVNGIITGDFGISKTGQKLQNYQPGIQILAKQTVFAEGARGSLSEKIIKNFKLRQNKDPQIYGIGLKQIWQVPESNFIPGKVQHTIGWPLPDDVYGGSFLYHMNPNQIHFGIVVGLDYENPYLNPYEQFQRLKYHPIIRSQLEGGECISYGSRVVNEGGYYAIPKLVFPGGLLVGCSAGFLNVMKIKGSHNAMKSGIQAGKSIYKALTNNSVNNSSLTIDEYEQNMKKSWTFKQLYETRNFKNSFKNIYQGLVYSGFFRIFGGSQLFEIRNTTKDYKNWTKPAKQFEPIEYPKHDRKLTFDLLDNLARSGTTHEHNQPAHLVVKAGLQESPYKSLSVFDGPEQRFCPAKVYEFVQDQNGGKKLQINAQNCLHCKTCDIKMVDEYIQWKVPQGNGGPQYNGM